MNEIHFNNRNAMVGITYNSYLASFDGQGTKYHVGNTGPLFCLAH